MAPWYPLVPNLGLLQNKRGDQSFGNNGCFSIYLILHRSLAGNPPTHPTQSRFTRLCGGPGYGPQFRNPKLHYGAPRRSPPAPIVGSILTGQDGTRTRGPGRGIYFVVQTLSQGIPEPTPNELLRLVCAKQGRPSERCKTRKMGCRLFCDSPKVLYASFSSLKNPIGVSGSSALEESPPVTIRPPTSMVSSSYSRSSPAA